MFRAFPLIFSHQTPCHSYFLRARNPGFPVDFLNKSLESIRVPETPPGPGDVRPPNSDGEACGLQLLPGQEAGTWRCDTGIPGIFFDTKLLFFFCTDQMVQGNFLFYNLKRWGLSNHEDLFLASFNFP